MTYIKKALAALTILLLAAALVYFGYMLPRRVTPILMYHAVSEDTSTSLNVTPENFARQMEFLSREGYSVIPLDELVDKIKTGRRYIPRTVVITFDDGYEDNYLAAFPVLSKYNMPATIFLITGYVGVQDRYATWDQVRLMMKNGIDFGGHTRNDVYLPAVDGPERLWDEINGSREDIARATGKAPLYFCYPTGGFDPGVKTLVKKAGYKGACTTNRGYDRGNTDVYELNRIKVTNSDTSKPFHFRAKLSGFYNVFRSERPGA